MCEQRSVGLVGGSLGCAVLDQHDEAVDEGPRDQRYLARVGAGGAPPALSVSDGAGSAQGTGATSAWVVSTTTPPIDDDASYHWGVLGDEVSVSPTRLWRRSPTDS